MSWIRIPMKFSGICITCNKKIEVNEVGLWAKGLGVKHEKCAEVNELQCMICRKSAGCLQCEFQDICDIQKVSPLCICKKCSKEKNPFSFYLKSTKKFYPLLNLNS